MEDINVKTDETVVGKSEMTAAGQVAEETVTEESQAAEETAVEADDTTAGQDMEAEDAETAVVTEQDDEAETVAVPEREDDAEAVSAPEQDDKADAEKPAKEKGSTKERKGSEEEQETVIKPEHPEAAIEAVLFATGNSVKTDKLAEILGMTVKEIRDAVTILKAQYEKDDRGITIIELDDALQLGTKGEYYSYLMKLTKSAKQYSLSDTVIETLSIIAYKQPVTRAQIEQIRGVSCDHALNKLLEYDLIEEVGRLDAPGKPLLFGTTEQFLRSFGVKSLGDLPTLSPELEEDFKLQAEAEAAENLKVDV